MSEIGVRELKERISKVLKRVREDQETYSITYRGRVVAKLAPAGEEELDREKFDRIWAEMDKLAEEIGKKWPKGV